MVVPGGTGGNKYIPYLLLLLVLSKNARRSPDFGLLVDGYWWMDGYWW
jgi:hypothetical protein